MSNRPDEYQSSVRWFLEKPWRGNSPMAGSRSQLGGLQAALVRLFEDCVASQDGRLTILGRSLMSWYVKVFQDDESESMTEITNILREIQKLLNATAAAPWTAALSQSLRQSLVQMIDWALARHDEVLSRDLLSFAREIAPPPAAPVE